MTELTKRFQEYSNFVKFLAEGEPEMAPKGVPLRFSNSSEKHSAVVLKQILKTAKKVYIYIDNPNEYRIYNTPNTIKSLRKFSLTKGNSMSIFTKDFTTLRIIKELEKYDIPLEIKFHKINEEISSKIKEVSANLGLKDEINFIVSDTDSYRISTFDSPSNYEAHVNFNDNKITPSLFNAIENIEQQL